MRTWKERVTELERKVCELEKAEQERKCAVGKHLPGEIHSPNCRPWVRCPGCYANLSSPELPKKV